MKEARSHIQKIRVLVGTYIPAEFHPGSNYITEISEDGITMYETQYKSRKPINKRVINNIPWEDIQKFFEDIYVFSRKINEWGMTVDDCSYTMTLYYSPYHKEIFEGACVYGNESLYGKIIQFVRKYETNEMRI